MNAHDVMVTSVVTVAPHTPVKEVAETLLRERISGVPVISRDGQVIGIVTEGDLLRRSRANTGRRHRWWLELFASSEERLHEFLKEHGQRAADVMTRPVIAVAEDTQVGYIVEIFERHKIKRVPVLKDGRLAGIVSRADLLRAMVKLTCKPRLGAADDNAIRDALLGALDACAWTDPVGLSVVVQDGTVELSGVVGTRDERRAVTILAQEIPGVTKVRNHLTVMQ